MKLYSISIYQFWIGMTTAIVVFALLWPLAWGQAAITGVVNRNANLRAGPGTTYAVVGRVPQGATVTIVETNPAGDWYQIGDELWVAAFLVDVINTTLIPTATAAIPTAQLRATATAALSAPGPTANRNANLRAGPGTTYAVVGGVQAGQALALSGRNPDGSWIQLEEDTWIAAFLVNGAPTELPVVVAPTPRVTTASISAPANTSTLNPGQVQIRLEPIFSGLEQPTLVTNAGDGSGRFFVLERPGRIRVYAGPNTEQQMFLDITDRVGHSGYEQGLLGLAFPPNFRERGYFFINYTNNDGDTIIARYQVSENPNQANRDSEFVVLFLDQPAPNHNGGMLLFGPDGYLWVGTGDGGGADDSFGNGQNPGTLFGAMLRLDVTSDPSKPYTIPASNPWVAQTWNGQEVRDEIWAIGLRNPWRYSFDRRTGDLWIGDVGQSQYEEIDYVAAQQVRQGGLNFGWPLLEGDNCRAGEGCTAAGVTPPVIAYAQAGNGCSVTGGYVYRGQAFPALNGVYLYADFCSGNLWGYWRTGGAAHTERFLTGAAAISSFGEDEGGELYVTDFGGGVVYQLVVE
ncbi:MAG: PQQ-dependent sugar dehydrogenase [Caldilineaceae bacterium]